MTMTCMYIVKEAKYFIIVNFFDQLRCAMFVSPISNVEQLTHLTGSNSIRQR